MMLKFVQRYQQRLQAGIASVVVVRAVTFVEMIVEHAYLQLTDELHPNHETFVQLMKRLSWGPKMQQVMNFKMIFIIFDMRVYRGIYDCTATKLNSHIISCILF
jgi:hypothetical protein